MDPTAAESTLGTSAPVSQIVRSKHSDLSEAFLEGIAKRATCFKGQEGIPVFSRTGQGCMNSCQRLLCSKHVHSTGLLLLHILLQSLFL